MKRHTYGFFGIVCALSAALPILRSAETFQVTRATKAEMPGGDEADGMIGDWVIRNDLVSAVMGNVAGRRDANQMTEEVQGAVIDFTTRKDNNDQLSVFYPMGIHVTSPSATEVKVLEAAGAMAKIEFSRPATKEEPWTAKTVYSLKNGDPYLHVETIYENPSAAAVLVPIEDRMRCDLDVHGRQGDGEHEVTILEDRYCRAAYGICSDDGRIVATELKMADYRDLGAHIGYPGIDPNLTRSVRLAPGEKVSLNRILIVGKDAAAVQHIADGYRKRNVPLTDVQVVDPSGRPVEDAYVSASTGGTYATSATSDGEGRVELPLVDGSYEVTVEQLGRNYLKRTLAVQNGASSEQKLVIGPRAFIAIDITEAGTGIRMPVKVEFRTRDEKTGAASIVGPFLGPDKRANGANNCYYSATGNEAIPIPPGNYEVHVSRGGEYSVLVTDVTVGEGDRPVIRGELTREVQSPHWITADLHNHDTGSGDCSISLPSKVINLAAAGIEFAPATDHNRISTYTPTIEALGLSRFIASTPGIELSGRPGPPDINHQTAFPLTIHDDKEGYGSPPTDANPYVQMERLYRCDFGSGKVIQQNHPNMGWLYYDRNRTGTGTLHGGFGTEPFTDVLEVRETMLNLLKDTDPGATHPTSRGFYWLQMLNQGIRIFGTANSDAHGVGPACGSIWNFIHVSDDDPAHADPWEIARSVRNGHVVMSNGPFVEASINGGIPGDTVKALAGTVLLKVKVQMADWSRIDRVQVLVNGRQRPDANFTRAANPEDFKDGVVQFDRVIPLKLDTDAYVVVVAAGEHETVSKLLGGRYARNIPIAVCNPIMVDIGGDGFTPNRDMLGVPFPNGKPMGRAPSGE